MSLATNEARTEFDAASPDPMPPALRLGPSETRIRTIGSAFTDTLLNVSLRGLDDTQVLGTKLAAELLKRGLQIVPATQEPPK